MDFLEKNLEDIIFETAQTKDGRIALRERGLEFPLEGKLYRQVNLGGYGIADLINVHIETSSIPGTKNTFRELNVEIIELKRGEIKQSALNQPCRYAKAVRTLAKMCSENIDNINVHITLIGSIVDSSSDTSFVYLYNEMEGLVDIYKFSYKFDGIAFEYVSHEWVKTNPNLPKDLISALHEPGIRTLKSIMTKTIKSIQYD